MTRKELCQWMEEFRLAAQTARPGSSVHEIESVVLGAIRDAMLRRRGRASETADPDLSMQRILDRHDAAALFDRDDGLGEVYQALHAKDLEAAYRATVRDRRKFTEAEIPAVSQLFTPRWVVELIVQNTLGRLWTERHPDTRLKAKWDWLVENNDRQCGAHSEGSRRVGLSSLSVSTEAPSVGPANRRLPDAAEIRVLDPACGTMNFGLVAFELLCDIYREECDRAGEAGWPVNAPVAHRRQIPAAVLRHNLFGIDIDPVALQLARATLAMKSGLDPRDIECNLLQADSLGDLPCNWTPAKRGSARSQLDDSPLTPARSPEYGGEGVGGRCNSSPQSRDLARQFAGGFDVVVTNPPYVSSRNLAADVVARLKKRFPAAWRDLYACFIERCIELTREGGRCGVLAMHSFMFTGSYQRLREKITDRVAIESLAHFGPGLFGVGNPGTLQTVAMIAQKQAHASERSARPLAAFRLVNVPADGKQAALRNAIRSCRLRASHCSLPEARLPAPESSITFLLTQASLTDLPRRSWAYWVDAPLRRAFGHFPRLADISLPRQGLATTDNFRFVRYWWEVEARGGSALAGATPGRWLPYAKGGRFRRWYEAPRHRVNWQDDGREIKQAIVDRYPYLDGQWKWVAKNTSYYGRGGVTWSYLTSGQFSAKRLETGAVFDVAGSSFFPEDVPGMLAILNSSVAEALLHAINPTVNFQVGDLAELPVPQPIPAELGKLAAAAIALQHQLDSFDETAPDFVCPMPWHDATERYAAIDRELAGIEQEIDSGVGELYGVKPPPSDSARNAANRATLDLADLARRWVSFAVGKLLGRWNGGDSDRALHVIPMDAHVLTEIRELLSEGAGAKAANEIEKHVKGIERFLAAEFFPWHVRMYRRRPPCWALAAAGNMALFRHDSATRQLVESLLGGMGQSLPADWSRNIDDGIVPGLAPLRGLVPDPILRRVLEEFARDAGEGRCPWAGRKGWVANTERL